MSKNGNKLDDTEAAVMRVLNNHKGEESAIPALELAGLAGISDRKLRDMFNHLITEHKIPLASLAGRGGGYFSIGSKKEALKFEASFKKRAITGLINAHRLIKAHFLKTSLQLTIDALVEGEKIHDAGEVISCLARELKKDPQMYREEIKALRSELGPLIVSHEQMAEINATASKLQELTKPFLAKTN